MTPADLTAYERAAQLAIDTRARLLDAEVVYEKAVGAVGLADRAAGTARRVLEDARAAARGAHETLAALTVYQPPPPAATAPAVAVAAQTVAEEPTAEEASGIPAATPPPTPYEFVTAGRKPARPTRRAEDDPPTLRDTGHDDPPTLR